MYLAAFFIVLIIVLCIFLGQIAVAFIKLEKKLEETVEVLEEELVDVFGAHEAEKQELKAADAPSTPDGPASPGLAKKA